MIAVAPVGAQCSGSCALVLRRVPPLNFKPTEPSWMLDKRGRLYPTSRTMRDERMSAVCFAALDPEKYSIRAPITDYSGGDRYSGWALVSLPRTLLDRVGVDPVHDRPDPDAVHPYAREAHVEILGLLGATGRDEREAEALRRSALAKGADWVEYPTVDERRHEYARLYGQPPSPAIISGWSTS